MNKKIFGILIALISVISCITKVRAQEVSDVSATLKTDSVDIGFDYRVQNLQRFLENYNSPLAPYAENFVEEADMNNLDYRLVASITGVESTFGKFIPSNSYNAYGWAKGDYVFSSWEESIAHVSKTLKISYIDKGAPTIAKIARRYAPPSTTWGSGVKFFIGKIDTLPLNFDII